MKGRNCRILTGLFVAAILSTQPLVAQTLATIITPANGATNVDPGAAFSWNAVSDAQAYFIWVGSAKGKEDVYGSGALHPSVTSITPTGLKTNTLYYLRLWTQINGIWGNYYVDTTFTTGSGSASAQLTYPSNKATDVDPWSPFTWTTVSGAQSYMLWIGTSQGAYDVYNSGSVTTTSLTVTGVKQNTAYWARLFTDTSQGSHYVDSQFTTGMGMAHLITPANGASNVNPFQPFTWNNVPGATCYYIYVGSTPGAQDIYGSGELSPNITSRIAVGMLGGKTYYVTLWTEINSSWPSVKTTIATAPQSMPSSASSFRNAILNKTGAVRLMTQGLTNYPKSGTPLAAVLAQDGNTGGAYCNEFARTLAEQLAGQNITARIRNTSFDGTAYEAHVTTEYYDPFLNNWFIADATFGVMYWNFSTSTGMSMSSLSSGVAAKNWSSINSVITYATNNGEAYGHEYYMDGILLYLNPAPLGGVVPVPVPNSPMPFMTVHSAADVGKNGIWLFSFANQADTLTISNPGSGTVVLKPLNNTQYSTAIALNTGWLIQSQPSGLQILTMNRYVYF